MENMTIKAGYDSPVNIKIPLLSTKEIDNVRPGCNCTKAWLTKEGSKNILNIETNTIKYEPRINVDEINRTVFINYKDGTQDTFKLTIQLEHD